MLLERAQNWVAEITRHARRLSEQHLGGSIRQQTLLDLAGRFADEPSFAHAEALGQVVFATTVPLHWRGEAPPPEEQPAWEAEPITVPLFAVRRGARQRLKPEETTDRSGDALERMIRSMAEREAAARSLAELFGPSGSIDLGELTVVEPAHRQRLLNLFYRAFSQRGRTGVGYRNWSVSVSMPKGEGLGELRAPDGVATLPHVRLTLHREGSA